MGLMKKAAKGTLAVSTLGTSVAAEKAVKVLAARGADVTHEEEAAGAIFVGMSHESGRNSKVSLYADRIERVKERSRMSVSSARQDRNHAPQSRLKRAGAERWADVHERHCLRDG